MGEKSKMGIFSALFSGVTFSVSKKFKFGGSDIPIKDFKTDQQIKDEALVKANAKFGAALKQLADSDGAIDPNGAKTAPLPEDILSKLKIMCPKGKLNIMTNIAKYAQTMERYDITPGIRRQMFLAQCAHESDGFNTTEEYASGKAYEGRKDLGNVVKGDGPKYKGSGLIQLTGRSNFDKHGKKLGIDLINHPELARAMPLALEVACMYWKDHGLNALADAGKYETITRRINGGLNGYKDRILYLDRAKKAGL